MDWKVTDGRLYLTNIGMDSQTLLEQLTQLVELGIHHTPNEDRSALAQLIALNQQQDNHDPRYLRYFEPLSGLNSPVKLSLRGTGVSDVSALSLAAHTNLVDLDLHCTNVQDLTPVGKILKLRCLNLWATPAQDFSPLAPLVHLEELYLGHARVEDLNWLPALTKMKILHLKGTPVKILVPLSALHDLEELNLEGALVEDLSPLFGLRNLQKLNIIGTKVKKTQVTRLARLIRHLDIAS